MRRLSALLIAAYLIVAVATPALAAKHGNDKKNAHDEKAAAYQKASDEEKQQMRQAIEEKASQINKKREDARSTVDEEMQMRLRNIEADSPGNVGPVGNN